MARISIGNIKGPQGIQGNDGEVGPVGPVGPPGPMGAVDNNTPIEFTEAAQNENIESGEAISEAFGKLKKWRSDLKDVAFSGNYDDLENRPDLPTPQEIGAASINDSTSCWKAYDRSLFGSVGWRRIATGIGSSAIISIKRNYNYDPPEVHIAQIDWGSSSRTIKSILDHSENGKKLFTKIRVVIDNNDQEKKYIDVYYNGANSNFLSISMLDIIPADGPKWRLIDAQVVPETAENETVAVTMDFKENYWIGDKPTPAEIGAMSKAGDTMTGTLNFIDKGIEISSKDNPTYGHAYGMHLFNEDKSGLKAGYGFYGDAGNIVDFIYMGVGRDPWYPRSGLTVSQNDIRWKDKRLSTVDVSIDITLSTDWVGSVAPFTQSITVSGVTADSIVDIDVQSSVTAEQLDAYIDAKIVDGGQAANSITLKAFGKKPTIAIPIKAVVRG